MCRESAVNYFFFRQEKHWAPLYLILLPYTDFYVIDSTCYVFSVARSQRECFREPLLSARYPISGTCSN